MALLLPLNASLSVLPAQPLACPPRGAAIQKGSKGVWRAVIAAAVMVLMRVLMQGVRQDAAALLQPMAMQAAIVGLSSLGTISGVAPVSLGQPLFVPLLVTRVTQAGLYVGKRRA